MLLEIRWLKSIILLTACLASAITYGAPFWIDETRDWYYSFKYIRVKGLNMIKFLFNEKGNIKYHNIMIIALLISLFHVGYIYLSNLITIPQFLTIPIILTLLVSNIYLLIMSGMKEILSFIKNQLSELNDYMGKIKIINHYNPLANQSYKEMHHIIFSYNIRILRC